MSEHPLARMPETGRAWTELRTEMISAGNGDAKWRDGKTAVYVFNAGEDVAQVQKEAYTLYMSENGLGPLAFPSLRQMEEDVVGMGLSLLHGGSRASGNITSGGTDSITMAIKSARNFARAVKGIQDNANLVVPFSAHPAFDKACDLMSLELRKIPTSTTLLADVDAMANAIDANTILIAGSAPSFPYGLIDPISELSELAVKKDIWLHVDACVGGYIAPFVRMNGAAIPPFDFELEGVCSISADLHKYGYCAKGASTVLFRDSDLHEHMRFDCANWPGGRMVTPTLAGTRPGGAISAAWAVMNYLGVEGYKRKQKQVTNAREAIEQGVAELGYETLGTPQLGIVAFTRQDLDVYSVYRQLSKRGWFTSFTTQPEALHLMLSPFHEEVTQVYLKDLTECTNMVLQGHQEKRSDIRYS